MWNQQTFTYNELMSKIGTLILLLSVAAISSPVSLPESCTICLFDLPRLRYMEVIYLSQSFRDAMIPHQPHRACNGKLHRAARHLYILALYDMEAYDSRSHYTYTSIIPFRSCVYQLLNSASSLSPKFRQTPALQQWTAIKRKNALHCRTQSPITPSTMAMRSP